LSGDPATATAAKNATANGTRKVTATASAAPKRPSNHHHRSTVSRKFRQIYEVFRFVCVPK